MDNKTLILIYDRMVRAVYVMKSNPEEQIKYLGMSIVIDEIALTFYNDATLHAENLMDVELIDNEQYDLIVNINNKLDEMGQNSELWTEEKLRDSEEWKECRSLAMKLSLKLEKNDIESFIINNTEWWND